MTILSERIVRSLYRDGWLSRDLFNGRKDKLRCESAAGVSGSRRGFLGGAMALAACGCGPNSYSPEEIRTRLAAFADQTARLPPSPTLPRTPQPPALRALTDLPVGTCFMPDQVSDAEYSGLASRQFSQLTPEWHFQLPAIMDDDGGYDWTWPDIIAEFARVNGQRLHGTSLVWYALDEVPAFRRLDGRKAEFAAAFERHIHTIVNRYRTATRSWDVVNEPIAEDGDGLRDSLWSRNLGSEDYMVRAFEAAFEADPATVLFVNDYNLELLPKKRATFMRLIDRLRRRGCKIGGVGSQTHLHADTAPGLVTAALSDLATLGLPIHISEFDVKFGRANQSPLSPEQKRTIQEALAAETVAAFMDLPAGQRHAFTVWGVRDSDSNLNRPNFGGDGTDTPLLFDDRGRPKPAFWAIAERLADGAADQ